LTFSVKKQVLDFTFGEIESIEKTPIYQRLVKLQCIVDVQRKLIKEGFLDFFCEKASIRFHLW